MNPETSAAISDLYRQINEQVASFQAATGLHCPPGCGQCCENPEVETSPLDMVPMALELIRRGEATLWLERLGAAPVPGRCGCYQADDQISGNGRCQMYLWRPTVCRLFGFAAVTDKTGTPKLAACARHKQHSPDDVAMAQVAIANGLSVPLFAEWQARVANIDPHWGHQHLPINQALRVAIERVSLYLTYETQNSGSVTARGGRPVEPEAAVETAPEQPPPV